MVKRNWKINACFFIVSIAVFLYCGFILLPYVDRLYHTGLYAGIFFLKFPQYILMTVPVFIGYAIFAGKSLKHVYVTSLACPLMIHNLFLVLLAFVEGQIGILFDSPLLEVFFVITLAVSLVIGILGDIAYIRKERIFPQFPKLPKPSRKLILILLILAILCGALAYGALTYRDYTLLRNSEFFADGPISIDAHIPAYVHAYRRLRANPFAVHISRTLARSDGTSAASTYAIMALKELDPDYAYERIERYRISGQTVVARFGCFIMTMGISEVFDDPYLNDLDYEMLEP